MRMIWVICLLLGLGACATVERELWLQVYDQSARSASSEKLGLSVEADTFREALKRWPDVGGNQLQRRALILSLNPHPSLLQKLDESRDPRVELAAIQKLMAH
jgi:hypothetical protein